MILEMKHISKQFPGVKALDDVNIRVKQGEIHCLVGENGAGKSTLMKVLSGVYPYGSYEGQILYGGSEHKFSRISQSEKAGISVIPQELALFPELSVYENIFFGHELMEKRLINWNKTIIEAQKLLERVGLAIDPSTKVRGLGVGTQQLIEIAKALSKDVRLLVLDEPTAALNEVESGNLLNLLRDLKKQGVTCIMISHKLKEVVAIADTITVLRDGSTVAEIDAAAEAVREQDIIKHMVGREISNIYPKRSADIGDVVFEVRNWSVYNPMSSRQILHNVNMNVRRGEIVGVAGLMGAGRTELAMSIFGNGLNHKILSGEVVINGKPMRFRNQNEAIKSGLAYVTEDRKKNGLVLMQNVRYNITIANLKQLTEGIVINEREEIVVAEEYRSSINIKTPSIEQSVGNLSGGNQQKVSLAKWLFAKPNILILDEPTRGIDVGAKYEIYSLMNKLVEDGMSIIMISSELLEVLGMSDRIYVLSDGVITGETSACEASEESIMTMATRTKEDVGNG
ncbi:ATP-binding cassette domain-containing protein [Christensenellaceae bacterium OttesenSCG-928-M15]|nr:ATP-binding cassette domain-containing protein [Christensenellaceae bacterium OttesenSCG-928-M15]